VAEVLLGKQPSEYCWYKVSFSSQMFHLAFYVFCIEARWTSLHAPLFLLFLCIVPSLKVFVLCCKLLVVRQVGCIFLIILAQVRSINDGYYHCSLENDRALLLILKKGKRVTIYDRSVTSAGIKVSILYQS